MTWRGLDRNFGKAGPKFASGAELFMWGVVGDVGSGDVSEGGSDENVGGEMFLGGVTREADSGGQRIGSPLDPWVMRIAMGDRGCEGKAGGGVSGGERSAASPELSGAVGAVGELAIESQLESEIDGSGGGGCGKRGEASFAKC